MNAVILKRNGVSYPQRLPKNPFFNGLSDHCKDTGLRNRANV